MYISTIKVYVLLLYLTLLKVYLFLLKLLLTLPPYNLLIVSGLNRTQLFSTRAAIFHRPFSTSNILMGVGGRSRLTFKNKYTITC